MFFKSVELNRFVCLHQSPAGWRPTSEFPLYARTCSTVTIARYYSSTHHLFDVFQGPLEKSLQNSVVSERQRNVEHKVSAIKNSAQVFFCPVCCLRSHDFHTDIPELSLSWVAQILLLTSCANHFPLSWRPQPRLTTQDIPGSSGFYSCSGFSVRATYFKAITLIPMQVAGRPLSE